MGEVAEYTREVLERIEEAHGLIIDTVEVVEDQVQILLEAPSKRGLVQVA